jgi:ligand-binding sensor domain-containing protein/signal transduction histidine kinase
VFSSIIPVGLPPDRPEEPFVIASVATPEPRTARQHRGRGVLVAVILLLLLVTGCGRAPEAATPLPPAGSEAGPAADGQGYDRPPADLTFSHLSLEDGLSEGTVYCTFQDSKGFLWFGTQDGLNKYDGYTFTIYRPDPTRNSIASSFVRLIREGPEGELWIATMGGGLDKFDPETERFTHYPYDPEDSSSLAGNWVRTVYLDPQGAIWAGTNNGLSRLDPDTEEMIRYGYDPRNPDSLSDPVVNAILRDSEGVLWVGTEAGLDRGDPTRQRFIHYMHDPADPGSLGGGAVRVIYEDRAGTLWIGTDGGLDRFDREGGRFVHYRHDPADPTSLSDNSVQSILEDREGVLWIGTNDGLNWFDREGERFTRYYHQVGDPSSLADNWIWSIYQDREGVLWIGNYRAGLCKYDRFSDRFTLLQANPDDPNSLNSDKIWAIYQDRDGILWIGTGGGGLNRYDREAGLYRHYQHDPADPNSLAHDEVRAIIQDHEGMLWIGMDGAGVDRFDPQTERFEHFQHDPEDPSSLSHDAVRVIYEDRENVLWIGTDGGGLNRFNRRTGRFDRFPPDPSNPSRSPGLSIWAIAEDRQGTLWIGTGGAGLRRYDRASETFTAYWRESNDIILSIHEDRQGNLWTATYGNGLYRFDREKASFTPYRTEDGLPSNAVIGILEDDEGRLWLSTNNGIARFDPRAGTFKNYDVSDGLQGNEFNGGAYFQSPDGEMWMGGTNGLNAFYPEAVPEDNPYMPPVVLTTLTQGGEPVVTDRTPDSIEAFRLEWPDNYFEFEFAALSFSRPERNQYAYMLEGIDRDWVDAGNRRFGRYTSLPGGSYTLRIRGSNGDGVWNQEGAAIRVAVVPPFWQTAPFRILAVVVLVAGAAGIYRQRVRSIEARSRELEREVEERTSEIEQRRRVAEGLREIVAVLNSDRPREEVLETIVAQAAGLLGAGAAVLHQVEPDDDRLAIQASHGLPTELEGIEAIPCTASRAEEVIATGRPLIVPDLALGGPAGDPIAARWRQTTLEHFRSFLAVPMTIAGRTDHCLGFYFAEPHATSSEELDLAIALAEQAMLAIENARLYAQAQELAAVQERQRLARDLHDAVSQTLFSASLIAEALPGIWESNPSEGEALLDKLRQLSRGALAEMRTLLMELRPAALTEASLKDLLNQLGQAVTGREGIPVSVDVDERLELPAEVHLVVYRVAQEALNNVIKHAQASQVDVALRGGAAGVILTIHDDGQGFEADKVSADHLGLNIMRERAAAIDARLEIASEPGRGTDVTLIWRSKGKRE